MICLDVVIIKTSEMTKRNASVEKLSIPHQNGFQILSRLYQCQDSVMICWRQISQPLESKLRLQEKGNENIRRGI